MKLAIQGCCHGELDAIYASLLRTEREQAIQIDALLLCGDFQAIRNHADLHALAVPQKYRQLGDFHAYYSGQKLAPILTLVIGGNHEASNYMHELYHGGWLAPNIYFLGAAGVVELNGLVVAGISGIYKEKDYNKGRFERLPYDAATIRSCYHTRVFDVKRLQAMQEGVDVVMSHDWPNRIEQWGNTPALIKKKPFFKDEIESRTLGSPPLMELLQSLKPKYWFSAHLHVKFAALFNHDASPTTQDGAKAPPPGGNANPEALDIDLDFDTEEASANTEAYANADGTESSTNCAPPQAGAARAVTRFLALHKCLPATPFLQIINHPSPHDDQLESRKAALDHQHRVFPSLRYNKRWLAITRAFHPHLSLHYQQRDLPDLSQAIADEERWVEENIVSPPTAATQNSAKRKQDQLEGSEATREDEADAEGLDIYRVQQFVRTAPAPFEPAGLSQGPPAWYTNPQTEAFCHFVGLQNKINPRPAEFHQPYARFPPPTCFGAHASQVEHPQPAVEVQSETADPNALAIDMDDLDSDGRDDQTTEAEMGEVDRREDVLTLSDDDELHARWKEGTG